MLGLLLDLYLTFNLSLKPWQRAGELLVLKPVKQDINLEKYSSLSLIEPEQRVEKIAMSKQIELKQKTSNKIVKTEEEVVDLKSKVVEVKKAENKTVKAEVKDKPLIEEKITQSKPGPADLDPLFTKYSQEYGVSKDLLVKIAACESGFNPGAQNGPYGGMFQFLASTWVSNRKAMGLDPNPNLRYNSEEAIRTAAFKISRDGAGAWPVCSRK